MGHKSLGAGVGVGRGWGRGGEEVGVGRGSGAEREETTSGENLYWCSLCHRVKFPNEVASRAGSCPRPVSGPGYLFGPRC